MKWLLPEVHDPVEMIISYVGLVAYLYDNDRGNLAG